MKNGSVLTDGVTAEIELKSAESIVTLIVPVTAVTDDTIRLQVSNKDGTSNVTIMQLSLEIA